MHKYAGEIITMSPNAMYALANIIELDGRPVSTHPISARGFAQVNCYVLVDGKSALLIESGFAVHEHNMLDQLGRVLDQDTRLTILVLRPSEYSSISNCRAIAERFAPERLMLGSGIPPAEFVGWLDYRPYQPPDAESVARRNLGAATKWSPAGQSEIPAPGRRRLQILRPELQLISTYWLYDAATRTLLTSDAFGHVWRPTAEGPWLVTDPDDQPSLDQMCDFLTNSRYWWLAGARTDPIRRQLDSLRERYDIERIAPSSGCVLVGHDVVDRHFDLLDAALRELSGRPALPADFVVT